MVKSARGRTTKKKKEELPEPRVGALIRSLLVQTQEGEEWDISRTYAGRLLDNSPWALPSDLRKILRKHRDEPAFKSASEKQNKRSATKTRRVRRTNKDGLTQKDQKSLRLLTSQISAGINAEPRYIPLKAFFAAASMSRTDPETEELMQIIKERYGQEAVPATMHHQTWSGDQQYENWLQAHAAYVPFHDADMRIMRHFAPVLKRYVPSSHFCELGPATGGKPNELFGLVDPPAAYEGIEFTSADIDPLRKTLQHHFKDAGNLITTDADFCDQALWKNYIKERWRQAREDFGRPVVCAMLGLTNGNLGNKPFGALLGNIFSCMGPQDIVIISNDATGTPGDGNFDIEAEIKKLNAAYNPPYVASTLHYNVHHALRVGGYEALNHRVATARVAFNPATRTMERSLTFDPPQPLRKSGSDRPLGMVGKINMPGSIKRSLNEMDNLADKEDGKILGHLPDPTGETRVSWVILARKNTSLPQLIL